MCVCVCVCVCVCIRDLWYSEESWWDEQTKTK